jgi:putative DNA-invertase from lambdoid prophage Rac
MATVLYARVSTTEQTVEHQRTQAEAAGFMFDEVLVDHGVSGVSTRLRGRTEGRRLFDMLRSGDTLVVRWVNRLGRNYDDITEVIREFIKRGVIVRTVISDMTFDGTATKPMEMAVRDSMIAFMAASAQAEAEATKEAQRAGIEHAKANGEGYRGRKPSYTREQLRMVQDMLGQAANPSTIAKATSLSRQTVYRIKDDPAAAEAALAVWEAA